MPLPPGRLPVLTLLVPQPQPALLPSLIYLELQKESTRLPGSCPFSQGTGHAAAKGWGCQKAQRPSQEGSKLRRRADPTDKWTVFHSRCIQKFSLQIAPTKCYAAWNSSSGDSPFWTKSYSLIIGRFLWEGYHCFHHCECHHLTISSLGKCEWEGGSEKRREA